MRFHLRTVALALLGLFFLASNTFAGRKKEIVKTFEPKEVVRLEAVSGDLEVIMGTAEEIEVRLIYDYEPSGSFRPEFRERGRTLRLSEDMRGSNRGSSLWSLTVPEGTEIKFNTASGDVTAEEYKGYINGSTASGDIVLINCEGEFDISTASGDVEVEDSNGDFDLSTASGDVIADGCEGSFRLSTASGDVEIDGITILQHSSFSSASGDVDVRLGAGPKDDVSVSTASGDVVLDYNGHPIEGYFEFVAKYRDGHIISPIDFDDEERFRRWGQRYVAKSFTRGSDSPQISIETASGRAELRE
ncbi:MAG: DUF4097 family beta strand repeat protein [Candidatus Zixiibacteriota bacterium]|nr:MAG: DUF4097 family beta strand repeat protein [candidate division Zixibacteria bacterium]